MVCALITNIRKELEQLEISPNYPLGDIIRKLKEKNKKLYVFKGKLMIGDINKANTPHEYDITDSDKPKNIYDLFLKIKDRYNTNTIVIIPTEDKKDIKVYYLDNNKWNISNISTDEVVKDIDKNKIHYLTYKTSTESISHDEIDIPNDNKNIRDIFLGFIGKKKIEEHKLDNVLINKIHNTILYLYWSFLLKTDKKHIKQYLLEEQDSEKIKNLIVGEATNKLSEKKLGFDTNQEITSIGFIEYIIDFVNELDIGDSEKKAYMDVFTVEYRRYVKDLFNSKVQIEELPDSSDDSDSNEEQTDMDENNMFDDSYHYIFEVFKPLLFVHDGSSIGALLKPLVILAKKMKQEGKDISLSNIMKEMPYRESYLKILFNIIPSSQNNELYKIIDSKIKDGVTYMSSHHPTVDTKVNGGIEDVFSDPISSNLLAIHNITGGAGIRIEYVRDTSGRIESGVKAVRRALLPNNINNATLGFFGITNVYYDEANNRKSYDTIYDDENLKKAFINKYLSVYGFLGLENTGDYRKLISEIIHKLQPKLIIAHSVNNILKKITTPDQLEAFLDNNKEEFMSYLRVIESYLNLYFEFNNLEKVSLSSLYDYMVNISKGNVSVISELVKVFDHITYYETQTYGRRNTIYGLTSLINDSYHVYYSLGSITNLDNIKDALFYYTKYELLHINKMYSNRSTKLPSAYIGYFYNTIFDKSKMEKMNDNELRQVISKKIDDLGIDEIHNILRDIIYDPDKYGIDIDKNSDLRYATQIRGVIAAHMPFKFNETINVYLQSVHTALMLEKTPDINIDIKDIDGVPHPTVKQHPSKDIGDKFALMDKFINDTEYKYEENEKDMLLSNHLTESKDKYYLDSLPYMLDGNLFNYSYWGSLYSVFSDFRKRYIYIFNKSMSGYALQQANSGTITTAQNNNHNLLNIISKGQVYFKGTQKKKQSRFIDTAEFIQTQQQSLDANLVSVVSSVAKSAHIIPVIGDEIKKINITDILSLFSQDGRIIEILKSIDPLNAKDKEKALDLLEEYYHKVKSLLNGYAVSQYLYFDLFLRFQIYLLKERINTLDPNKGFKITEYERYFVNFAHSRNNHGVSYSDMYFEDTEHYKNGLLVRMMPDIVFPYFSMLQVSDKLLLDIMQYIDNKELEYQSYQKTKGKYKIEYKYKDSFKNILSLFDDSNKDQYDIIKDKITSKLDELFNKSKEEGKDINTLKEEIINSMSIPYFSEDIKEKDKYFDDMLFLYQQYFDNNISYLEIDNLSDISARTISFLAHNYIKISLRDTADSVTVRFGVTDVSYSVKVVDNSIDGKKADYRLEPYKRLIGKKGYRLVLDNDNNFKRIESGVKNYKRRKQLADTLYHSPSLFIFSQFPKFRDETNESTNTNVFVYDKSHYGLLYRDKIEEGYENGQYLLFTGLLYNSLINRASDISNGVNVSLNDVKDIEASIKRTADNMSSGKYHGYNIKNEVKEIIDVMDPEIKPYVESGLLEGHTVTEIPSLNIENVIPDNGSSILRNVLSKSLDNKGKFTNASGFITLEMYLISVIQYGISKDDANNRKFIHYAKRLLSILREKDIKKQKEEYNKLILETEGLNFITSLKLQYSGPAKSKIISKGGKEQITILDNYDDRGHKIKYTLFPIHPLMYPDNESVKELYDYMISNGIHQIYDEEAVKSQTYEIKDKDGKKIESPVSIKIMDVKDKKGLKKVVLNIDKSKPIVSKVLHMEHLKLNSFPSQYLKKDVLINIKVVVFSYLLRNITAKDLYESDIRTNIIEDLKKMKGLENVPEEDIKDIANSIIQNSVRELNIHLKEMENIGEELRKQSFNKTKHQLFKEIEEYLDRNVVDKEYKDRLMEALNTGNGLISDKIISALLSFFKSLDDNRRIYGFMNVVSGFVLNGHIVTDMTYYDRDNNKSFVSIYGDTDVTIDWASQKTVEENPNIIDRVKEIGISSGEEKPTTHIEFIEDTSANEDESIGNKYSKRTYINAQADATIALAIDFETGGEKSTKNAVINQGKHYISERIPDNLEVTEDMVNGIIDKLNLISSNKGTLRKISLNIAGNGIYTISQKTKHTQSQIDDFVYRLLDAVIKSPNLKVKIASIQSGGQTGIDEAGAKAGLRLGIPTKIIAPRGWIFRVSKEIYEKEYKNILPADTKINTSYGAVDIFSEEFFKKRFGDMSIPSKETTITTTKPKDSIVHNKFDDYYYIKVDSNSSYKKGGIVKYKIGYRYLFSYIYDVIQNIDGQNEYNLLVIPKTSTFDFKKEKSHTSIIQGIYNLYNLYKDQGIDVAYNLLEDKVYLSHDLFSSGNKEKTILYSIVAGLYNNPSTRKVVLDMMEEYNKDKKEGDKVDIVGFIGSLYEEYMDKNISEKETLLEKLIELFVNLLKKLTLTNLAEKIEKAKTLEEKKDIIYGLTYALYEERTTFLKDENIPFYDFSNMSTITKEVNIKKPGIRPNPQPVKISINDHMKSFLLLPDIDDIYQLDEKLKDDVFYEQHRDFLNILPARVPIQLPSSISVNRIYGIIHSNGSIIAPSIDYEKTGGDNDEDKLTIIANRPIYKITYNKGKGSDLLATIKSILYANDIKYTSEGNSIYIDVDEANKLVSNYQAFNLYKEYINDKEFRENGKVEIVKSEQMMDRLGDLLLKVHSSLPKTVYDVVVVDKNVFSEWKKTFKQMIGSLNIGKEGTASYGLFMSGAIKDVLGLIGSLVYYQNLLAYNRLDDIIKSSEKLQEIDKSIRSLGIVHNDKYSISNNISVNLLSELINYTVDIMKSPFAIMARPIMQISTLGSYVFLMSEWAYMYEAFYLGNKDNHSKLSLLNKKIDIKQQDGSIKEVNSNDIHKDAANSFLNIPIIQDMILYQNKRLSSGTFNNTQKETIDTLKDVPVFYLLYKLYELDKDVDKETNIHYNMLKSIVSGYSNDIIKKADTYFESIAKRKYDYQEEKNKIFAHITGTQIRFGKSMNTLVFRNVVTEIRPMSTSKFKNIPSMVDIKESDINEFLLNLYFEEYKNMISHGYSFYTHMINFAVQLQKLSLYWVSKDMTYVLRKLEEIYPYGGYSTFSSIKEKMIHSFIPSEYRKDNLLETIVPLLIKISKSYGIINTEIENSLDLIDNNTVNNVDSYIFKPFIESINNKFTGDDISHIKIGLEHFLSNMIVIKDSNEYKNAPDTYKERMNTMIYNLVYEGILTSKSFSEKKLDKEDSLSIQDALWFLSSNTETVYKGLYVYTTEELDMVRIRNIKRGIEILKEYIDNISSDDKEAIAVGFHYLLGIRYADILMYELYGSKELKNNNKGISTAFYNVADVFRDIMEYQKSYIADYESIKGITIEKVMSIFMGGSLSSIKDDLSNTIVSSIIKAYNTLLIDYNQEQIFNSAKVLAETLIDIVKEKKGTLYDQLKDIADNTKNMDRIRAEVNKEKPRGDYSTYMNDEDMGYEYEDYGEPGGSYYKYNENQKQLILKMGEFIDNMSDVIMALDLLQQNNENSAKELLDINARLEDLFKKDGSNLSIPFTIDLLSKKTITKEDKKHYIYSISNVKHIYKEELYGNVRRIEDTKFHDSVIGLLLSIDDKKYSILNYTLLYHNSKANITKFINYLSDVKKDGSILKKEDINILDEVYNILSSVYDEGDPNIGGIRSGLLSETMNKLYNIVAGMENKEHKDKVISILNDIRDSAVMSFISKKANYLRYIYNGLSNIEYNKLYDKKDIMELILSKSNRQDKKFKDWLNGHIDNIYKRIMKDMEDNIPNTISKILDENESVLYVGSPIKDSNIYRQIDSYLSIIKDGDYSKYIELFKLLSDKNITMSEVTRNILNKIGKIISDYYSISVPEISDTSKESTNEANQGDNNKALCQ